MSNRDRRRGCNSAEHPPIGRREVLQAGGMALFGASFADLLRLEAQASHPSPRQHARAIVFIFQSGGPSQHETFDPK